MECLSLSPSFSICIYVCRCLYIIQKNQPTRVIAFPGPFMLVSADGRVVQPSTRVSEIAEGQSRSDTHSGTAACLILSCMVNGWSQSLYACLQWPVWWSQSWTRDGMLKTKQQWLTDLFFSALSRHRHHWIIVSQPWCWQPRLLHIQCRSQRERWIIFQLLHYPVHSCYLHVVLVFFMPAKCQVIVFSKKELFELLYVLLS